MDLRERSGVSLPLDDLEKVQNRMRSGRILPQPSLWTSFSCKQTHVNKRINRIICLCLFHSCFIRLFLLPGIRIWPFDLLPISGCLRSSFFHSTSLSFIICVCLCRCILRCHIVCLSVSLSVCLSVCLSFRSSCSERKKTRQRKSILIQRMTETDQEDQKQDQNLRHLIHLCGASIS